jgi:hypothetical protein
LYGEFLDLFTCTARRSRVKADIDIYYDGNHFLPYSDRAVPAGVTHTAEHSFAVELHGIFSTSVHCDDTA